MLTQSTPEELKAKVAQARAEKLASQSPATASLTVTESTPTPRQSKKRQAAEGKKLGRPTLPDGEARESITLRFKPDERLLIKAAADIDSMTVSAWIRQNAITQARNATGEDSRRLLSRIESLQSLFLNNGGAFVGIPPAEDADDDDDEFENIESASESVPTDADLDPARAGRELVETTFVSQSPGETEPSAPKPKRKYNRKPKSSEVATSQPQDNPETIQNSESQSNVNDTSPSDTGPHAAPDPTTTVNPAPAGVSDSASTDPDTSGDPAQLF